MFKKIIFFTFLLVISYFCFAIKSEAAPTYTQTSYRFYVDNDAVQPTDPWPSGVVDLAENIVMATTTSPLDDGELVRIRMSVAVATDNLNASTQAFKLQYGFLSTTSTTALCSSISTWYDVGAAGSNNIWLGESDGSPSDGTTLSSGLLTGSTVMASYEEQNNSVSNPNAINIGEIGEWDWLIENNGAYHDDVFCFRMVLSDGTALGTYTNYPTIHAEWTTFDSSIEGGNGRYFYKPYNSSSTSISFQSELDGGATPNATICSTTYVRQNWFYFSMNNTLNQTFTITMINAGTGSNEQSTWTDLKPVYSYDQVTWYRIDAIGSLASNNYTFVAPGAGNKFTGDTVYIAYNIPYTYTNLLTDIGTWDDSSLVTTSTIGNSTQGRIMYLLTIQDTNSPVTAANKKVYWIVARQHPLEPGGNYEIKGVIDFLIGGSAEANLILRSSIFKIVPMVNVDGAYQGWTRSNENQCDLNREWASSGYTASNMAAEIFNIQTVIDTWMTSGTPNTVTFFLDYHTKSSAYPGFHHPTGETPNPYDVLFKILDANAHANTSYVQTTTSISTVAIYNQYNVSKGLKALLMEGPDIRWSATSDWPTAQAFGAYGLAAMKTVWALNQTETHVFALTSTSFGGTFDDNKYVLIGSPSDYFAVLDEDNGGGIKQFYDWENDGTNLSNQLIDADSVLDPIDWNDGTQVRSLINSTNASYTINSYGGERVNLKYTGLLEDVSDENYTLERTIYGDGRINTQFVFTNNTGSTINFADMKHSISVDYAERTNFNQGYDNTDLTPTPATDNWWGFFGNGGGSVKASFIANYISQSGGWVYDTYASTSDATYGLSNWYTMTDGPSIANGSAVTTTIIYLVKPDNDSLANETHADAWRNDFANPDTPTMSYGTFTEYNAVETGLQFAASSNAVNFTYTNADSFTKKQPVFVITNYTASTAPVLKVDGVFLDSETGAAHSADLHTGTSYSSSVNTTNDIAYVQYYSDISTNDDIIIGASIPSGTPTAPSGASASYSTDTETSLAWTDAASDEDGFKIERRDDTGSGWGSFTQIGTASSNAITFTDNSTNNPSNPPAANNLYQYRVRAYNVAGNSNYSTDISNVTTTPAAPTIGIPTIDSSTAITWSWTDNANFEDSYRIDFTTGSGTDADGIAANSSSYQSTGLTPNTQYAVHVHAYQSDRGESTASDASTAVYTLANVPGTPSLSYSGSANKITANWSANSNPLGTEYYIENTTAGTNSGWITTTSWDSSNLNCGTTYVLKVKARNSDTTETSFSSTASQFTFICPTSSGSQINLSPVNSPSFGNVYPANGGSVSKNLINGGNIEVIMSSNTVTSNSELTITPLYGEQINLQYPLLNGRQFVGNLVAEIKLTDNLNTSQQSFNKPVTIIFNYNEDQVKQYGSEDNLRIYYYNDEINEWLPIYSSFTDKAANKVTANVYHFSRFSLVTESPTAAVIEPLVKTSNDSKVYVITTKNFKRHIPNEEIFNSYGFNWLKIATVNQAEINSYQVSNLIKVVTSPKVYQLTGTTKDWIPNEATFNNLGLSWAAISTVNQTELDYYQAAGDINVNNNINNENISPTGKFVFTNFLTIGAKGEEVRQLQIKLKDLGYFNYPTITGFYGNATQEAVKAFQKANGIKQVGYVGPATREALNKL